jgi:hypothetical protein
VPDTDDDVHCGETLTADGRDPTAYASCRNCERVLSD